MAVKPDPKVDAKTQAEIQRDMQERVLESAKYPDITFRSSRVEKQTDGQWKVEQRPHQQKNRSKAKPLQPGLWGNRCGPCAQSRSPSEIQKSQQNHDAPKRGAKIEAGVRELNLGSFQVIDADGNPVK